MQNKHTRRGFTQITDYLSLEGESGTQYRVRGKDNKANLIGAPSSALGASSPSRGKQTLHGFTLMELLVVVLIIGILAAVALPQYKIAVAKSRIAAILPIVATLHKATKVYYLATGNSTPTIQELDVNIPCTESIREDDNMPFWTCGNDFLVQVSSLFVYASYCPSHNQSFEECSPVRDIQIEYTDEDIIHCIVRNDSTLGEKVCKTLGKFRVAYSGLTYYQIK